MDGTQESAWYTISPCWKQFLQNLRWALQKPHVLHDPGFLLGAGSQLPAPVYFEYRVPGYLKYEMKKGKSLLKKL